MRKMKNIISVILFISTTHLFPPKVLCQDSSVNISYKKIGADNKDIKNIENILLKNGVEKKNLDQVKRCIILIAKDISNQSYQYELSDKIKNHLEEISVKPSQIGMIKRIAHRISLKNSDRQTKF